MHLIIVRQVLPFVWFLSMPCFALFAQQAINLQHVDAAILRYGEQGVKDSFLFYSAQKLQFARQTDQLALWGWAQLDIHDFFSGDDQKALELLEKAWKERWREPLNAEEWEPFLYIQANRGWFLFRTGKVWPAVQAYETAAQLYERFRYPDFEAVEMIYKPLGNHFTRLRDNEKALAVFQKALALGGDHETLAGLYSNIGVAQWNRGDFAAAAGSFRQGLDLKHISDAKTALLLAGLAQTFLDEGDAPGAYKTAARALQYLSRPASDKIQTQQYRARTLRTYGLAALALGRRAEAEQSLRNALALAREAFGNTSRDVSKIEIALSGLLQQQGKYPAAIDAANRALSAAIPRFRPKKPEENPAASDFYEENTLAEALEAKAAAAGLLYGLSRDTGHLSLALACYDLAWRAEAGLRRVFQYHSSKLDLQKDARSREESAINIARLLFEKTGQTVYLEKAFAIAERSKATLLFEALQDNLVRQRLSGKDSRFTQIAQLRRQLAYFERNMILEPQNRDFPQWRLEADALAGRIAVLERAVDSDYPNLRNPDADAGTGILAEGQALLAYFVSEKNIDIFLFRQNKPPVWVRRTHDDAIKSLYRDYTAFFSSADAILRAPGEYLETAHRLWKTIVPAEAAGAGKLIVIPDGFLHFIPFEALVSGEPAPNTSLRNADYVVRRQEICYAWSLAVWKKQHVLTSGAGKCMLAFSPVFAGGERGLAPLHSEQAEGSFAGNWGADHLRGPAADLKHYLENAGRYRVLHFSTHAFADAEPRIELYDRAMFLPDIYATPLHADLVVLSACQTGLGREQKGEGVMSLARAFAQAGAACTISSLWSVNDRSTAQLLDRFYNYLDAGRTLGDALRQAKLNYLDDREIGAGFQTPYFWAGFTAVGDDRKIGGCNNFSPLFWAIGGIFLIGLMIILHHFYALNQHFQWKNRWKAGNPI